MARNYGDGTYGSGVYGGEVDPNGDGIIEGCAPADLEALTPYAPPEGLLGAP